MTYAAQGSKCRMNETWPFNRGYFVDDPTSVGSGLKRTAYFAPSGQLHSEADHDVRIDQFGPTTTPQGMAPTLTLFTTFSAFTSMIEISLETPFVETRSFSSGVNASCQTR